MRSVARGVAGVVALVVGGLTVLGGGSDSAAERGRAALVGKSFLPPAWSLDAYSRAGRSWDHPAPDPTAEPDAYAEAFRARYGLHPAPYQNDGLPMGLRRARDGARVGLQLDCLLCHGGSIGGTSYVGLGNTTLDLDAFVSEMTRGDGRFLPPRLFTLNTTRGTVNAGQIAVVLFSLRNTDLSRRAIPLALGAHLPELDVPAWWTLGRKATMYYDGRTDARSARSLMQFLLGDFTLEQFQAAEPEFRDILAYLKSLKPPRYPFAIDRDRVERGRTVFNESCAKCHGTYGPGGSYPSRIVDLKVIGTDPARALGLSDRLVAHYNATWFGEDYAVEEFMTGYQAPPLDGIWATAPYLHNGSVPTLAALLESSTRPSRFRKPPTTDFAHYDPVHVGWKVEPVTGPIPPGLSIEESRRIYDTSRFGLGNRGHTFGDRLTDDQRKDVIEYLKTL